MSMDDWRYCDPWNPHKEQELEQEFRALQRNVVDARQMIDEWRVRMNEVATELERVQRVNKVATQAALPLKGVAVPSGKRGPYRREKTVLTNEIKAVHIGKRMQIACERRLTKRKAHD